MRNPQPADNLILWLPVFLITGISVYFLSPFALENSWTWVGILSAAILSAISYPLRHYNAWRWIVVFVFAFLVGLLLIEQRVGQIHTPLLSDRVWNEDVTGTIQSFEQSGNHWTVVLGDARIPGQDKNYVFRLSVRQKDFTPQVGGIITAKSSLMPPSSPLVPDSYDFRRHAFFDGISGYGYTTQIVSYQAPPEHTEDFLETYRDWLAQKVFANLKQPEAGIVSSLLTGQRAGIHKRTSQALQQSGLYHVISISGLHVSLMATIIFFTARFLMALSMNLALRFPIKKIAAFMALIGIVIYMLIVGMSPPTLRSVIMTGMVLVAIILDREPIQMRVIALSALCILCLQPESAIDVGFQMSFGAVIGLVAFYQGTKSFWVQPFWQESFILKCLRLLLGSLLTSLVATIATAPLVLYYFQQIPMLSMLSNLLASAPISFLIMPGTFLAYLFAPVPILGDFAIQMMGWGTTMMVNIAITIAHIPSAIWRIPAIPLWSVNLMLLGMFMLTAIKHQIKWSGVGPILLGVLLIIIQPQPDLMMTQGRILLQADREKDILYFDGRLGGFEQTLMLQHSGLRKAEPLQCDQDICDFEVKGRAIRVIRSIPALEQGCDRPADLILTRYYFNNHCGATRVIDRHRLERTGGQAIYLGKTIRIESALRGRRWHEWEWMDKIK